MDKKEHLKSMLTNIVHDKNEEAAVDFHNYLQATMRDSVNPPVEAKEEEAPTDTDTATE